MTLRLAKSFLSDHKPLKWTIKEEAVTPISVNLYVCVTDFGKCMLLIRLAKKKKAVKPDLKGGRLVNPSLCLEFRVQKLAHLDEIFTIDNR